ncbi:MAG TPA: hypothetical protein PK264_11725 [Hyphomicrobiaceae bacterium]|nr:hypothetical protein [Hyphomicrobiaceae bacterium]
MIIWLADAIRDQTFLKVYLCVGLAIMLLPVIVLTVMYNVGIRRTPGGRRLLKEQNRPGTSRSSGTAIVMARDITRGVYGEDARRLQNRTYWLFGAWLLAVVLVFGALIWAQDINKRRDAQPTPATTRER